MEDEYVVVLKNIKTKNCSLATVGYDENEEDLKTTNSAISVYNYAIANNDSSVNGRYTTCVYKKIPLIDLIEKEIENIKNDTKLDSDSKSKQLVKLLKIKQNLELEASAQQLREAESEMSKWPEYKKDCNFFKVKEK